MAERQTCPWHTPLSRSWRNSGPVASKRRDLGRPCSQGMSDAPSVTSAYPEHPTRVPWQCHPVPHPSAAGHKPSITCVLQPDPVVTNGGSVCLPCPQDLTPSPAFSYRTLLPSPITIFFPKHMNSLDADPGKGHVCSPS